MEDLSKNPTMECKCHWFGSWSRLLICQMSKDQSSQISTVFRNQWVLSQLFPISKSWRNQGYLLLSFLERRQQQLQCWSTTSLRKIYTKVSDSGGCLSCLMCRPGKRTLSEQNMLSNLQFPRLLVKKDCCRLVPCLILTLCNGDSQELDIQVTLSLMCTHAYFWY